MIRRLEARFAKTFHSRYAIAMCNGTATLHAALAAVGVKPGDEVIVPPLTMMSTTFAVLHAGATPVFADVDPDTWTLDPTDVARKVSRKTKAILPVALYGCPPSLDELHRIARARKIAVIEDNAQAVLATYRSHILGSESTFASFSFQNSKALAAGEGGILITSDRALAQSARRFAGLGFGVLGASRVSKAGSQRLKEDPAYERHVSIGWNYAISEPSAAIALAQTERIQEIASQRLAVAALWRIAHQGCSWLIPQSVPAQSQHAYWTYALLLAKHAPVDWQEFHDTFLRCGGDALYAAWQLNYLEPVLIGKRMGRVSYRRGLCPVAESLQPRLLQFKTNMLELSEARAQARALRRAIARCSRS